MKQLNIFPPNFALTNSYSLQNCEGNINNSCRIIFSTFRKIFFFLILDLSLISELIYVLATFSLCLHIAAAEHDRGSGFDWRHRVVLWDEFGW
jgi:hypothetical protein